MFPSIRECPRCENERVWKSRAGAIRFLARLVGLHAVRCEGCSYRYWGFSVTAPPKRPPVSRKHSDWGTAKVSRPPSSTATRPVSKGPGSNRISV